jgi:hypothetical protein
MALVQPPSVLCLGDIGSGKTTSLVTLALAGLDVFVIITEPTGLDSLLDAFETNKAPIEKLHYKVITPARAEFGDLLEQAKRVSVMDYESLSKQKPQGNRQQSKFLELVASCKDFTCDRTGTNYGSISNLPDTAAFCVDSFSGVSLMAWDLTVGDKVSAHQGEWGVAMNMLSKLVNSWTSNLNCFFVLTSHLEMETDELTGARKQMVSTLGRKLAPTIPRFFSEAVVAYRKGQNFYWSTDMMGVTLKKRSLPLGSELAPDYRPIVEAYYKRKQLAGGSPKENPTPTIQQTQPNK